MQIVEFPSYEEAMANSSLPETGAFAERLAQLCDGPPSFRNLDVCRVDDLALAGRLESVRPTVQVDLNASTDTLLTP